MSFVNTIADIVHSEVHDHEGAANKNIGDAFLLVWKFRSNFSYGLLHNAWPLCAKVPDILSHCVY